jgi:hypothetical protein
MSSMNPAGENRIRSVLIVYDFSEASRKPLHRAIAIARHFEAKLHVAYVVSSKTTSHLPWSVAHKIVCGASCPVMTMKAAASQSAIS